MSVNSILDAQEAPPHVERRRAEPERATNLFMSRAYNCYAEKGKEAPKKAPPFVHHTFQVESVGLRFIYDSNLSLERQQEEAAKVIENSKYHDIGRTDGEIGRNTQHPEDGYRILKDEGIPEEVRGFCLDHDMWGVGRSIDGRPNNLQLAKENPRALLEKYDEKYGFAGIATMIADNAKRYPKKGEGDILMPMIAPLTRELSAALIDRQIAIGNYALDDEKHKAEKVGVDFAFAAISYMEEKYGVTYRRAVENAQDEWPARAQEMEKLWANEAAKAEARKILTVTND